MKKQYTKMNNNDEHLSIGNLFRLIKDMSKNKLSALQSELFCILFELDSINDTTVNNYCVGCRSIGSDYRQIFLNKEKKYKKNPNIFTDSIIGVINIIEGTINSPHNKIEFINTNESANNLAKKMYNLAKNDKQVLNEFTNKLYLLIHNNKIYECLVEELLFIVLEKKQPLYEEELKKEVLENVLNDTSISSIDLQEYLSLKLREGINFDYSMKKLADKKNAYANFELGSNEYYGYVTGTPRYDRAFKYLSQAAEYNHASANYMIGNMYIRGLLGRKTKEELQLGYDYLITSYNLGNIAASNLLGLMHLNGIYPIQKNEAKAIAYFTYAKENDYAYAYNNLGRMAETKGNLKEAFKLYKTSADLGESWACNKIGEMYRLGIIEKNMEQAYYYYNRAIESNHNTLCYYAYYNLAKYFYINGYEKIILTKEEQKAIAFYKIASDNNHLPSTIELFNYNLTKYLRTRNKQFYDELYNLKNKIETHKEYNEKIKNKIEKSMKDLVSKKEINMNLIEKI